jgi:replicative DNA helicase
MRQAQERARTSKIEAHLLIKPAGIDLLTARDRILIEDVIEKTRPDLICLGPLYKSFVDPGSRTSEAIAIEVAKYLDTIRTHYNCALWLEHHAPLGSSVGGRDLRPFGSAVWSRWPEFGLALEPDPTAAERYTYIVKNFRGERDVRNWPKRMQRDELFPFKVIEFRTP